MSSHAVQQQKIIANLYKTIMRKLMKFQRQIDKKYHTQCYIRNLENSQNKSQKQVEHQEKNIKHIKTLHRKYIQTTTISKN